MKKKKYTPTSQKGEIGHCFMAQVFKNGKAFINVEPTKDESEATNTAILIAELLNKHDELHTRKKR